MYIFSFSTKINNSHTIHRVSLTLNKIPRLSPDQINSITSQASGNPEEVKLGVSCSGQGKLLTELQQANLPMFGRTDAECWDRRWHT